MEKTVQVFQSFHESDRADRRYYHSLTPQARLAILFDLNARHWQGIPDAARGFVPEFRIIDRGKIIAEGTMQRAGQNPACETRDRE